jgi:sugar phosphate isomerase/epimerase
MRIGVCTAPENVSERIEGLSFIEPTVGGLLCPQDDKAGFAKRLAAARDAPLPVEAVNCLLPAQMKTTGPAVDADAVEAWIRVVCRRARQVGIKWIVFGSGGSRRVPEGFDPGRAFEQLVEHLKRWGPIAGEENVIIVIEPLNRSETNIINSVDEGAELARRADHPNIRLLADTYHMAKDGDPPEAIRRAGGLIVHAHCAEAVGRAPVGFGGEDHRPYFRALKDVGYKGGVSIEANFDSFQEELPRAVAELRKQIESA